jgi:hypothetical protein
MSSDYNMRCGFVRIDPTLGRRIKAVAALRGVRVRDVMDTIVPDPLDKLERETKSRYQGSEKPARTRPIE